MKNIRCVLGIHKWEYSTRQKTTTSRMLSNKSIKGDHRECALCGKLQDRDMIVSIIPKHAVPTENDYWDDMDAANDHS